MTAGVVSVCGLCICASLICKITEKYSKEQAMLLVLGVCIFVFLILMSNIPDIFSKIDELINRSEQFSADICRDCNENAIASAVEISGKIQLIILALPLFDLLIDTVMVIME